MNAEGAEIVAGLPPGPRWPALLQTLAMNVAFDRFATTCTERFGPIMTLRLLGFGPMVAVSDPTLIRQVFTGDPDVLHSGAANAQLSAVLGHGSMILLDGQRHLRRRKLLLPPFHGEAVRAYAGVVCEITTAEIARWPRGRSFPILPRARAITLEAILRLVVGVRDEERLARLRALLPRVTGSMAGIVLEGARPGLADGRLAPRLPWVRARLLAGHVLDEEIAAHRAAPEGRDDVLALLIAARDEDDCPLSDEELRSELLTLLLAGHETTATALAWCFERLVRHPDVLARLQDEIARGDDAYLDAVISETLRSRPVVDSAQRLLTAEFELGGYRLPAGTRIAPSIWAVQHSAAFEAPERFEPERFLDRRVAPYTLIPFGGGVRRCIGASFAEMELRTVLRTVLGQVDLQPTSAASEKSRRGRGITTVPARGGRVAVADRHG
ncbi:MAG TPA: cytochrome P450 [Solirubrobacteraceae bacterium]|jgi:cytochrome P450|nr:cytochrome P450 [Solirubrobacteraceae bacterium]